MNESGLTFSSLRVRLTLWYVLVLAVILVLFSLGVYNAIRLSKYREVETTLVATAEIITTKLEDNGLSGFIVDPSELPLGQEIFFQITTLQGARVQSRNLAQSGATLPRGEEAQDAALRGQTFLQYVALENGVQVQLLTQGYRRLGFIIDGIVQVAVSLEQAQKDLEQLRFWLWTIVPITLLLTSLGGLFLADRLLRPLVNMIASAREIRGQKLNRRLPVGNPNDELGQLAITLNELFDRLERAFKNQQRFIADASHELRTPLAAMQAEIEVALRRQRNQEEYLALIKSNLDEVKRLSSMAERLLFLTQSDAGQLPLMKRTVHLDELCQHVLQRLVWLADEKGVDLQLKEVCPVEVQGDSELLEQLIMILVENALKYTPSGGRVVVSCGADEACTWLEVQDTGAGIAAEHIPHLFERFYRVDKARSRQFGGTGLGLSIAQSIIRAHGGQIEVDTQSEHGTTFRAVFPS